MKLIRILHVIRPAEGGMKGHLLALAAGLQKSGYDIEVACPGYSSLAQEIRALGLVVHYINLVGPLSPVLDYRCVIQLYQILRQGEYDIHGAKAGFVGRIAAVFARCQRTVLTVHNFIIYDEVPLAKKVLFKYGDKLLSRVTTEIITVSEALRVDLIDNFQINPEQITPVYNGIDTARYSEQRDSAGFKTEWGIGQAKNVIGTLARMAPQKGLQYLLDAVALIKKRGLLRGVEIACVIAGDGPLREELVKQAQALGIEDEVVFPGFVQDVPGFLACLDVFVIPSVAEGLSITTIEAMAAGLPVVASRVGGLPELVTEGVTGYLVEPRNSSALAQAILQMIGEPEEARKMGQQGRALACRVFSNEAMVTNTCKVYGQVLASAT